MSALKVMKAMMHICPPAHRADQREHLVDTGDQCGPQVVRGGAWFGLGLRLRLYHYTRPADRDCCDGRQISAALLEPLHRKWWPRAVTQQLLQPCAVGRFDAHPGIDREAASVGISGHVFGVTCLNVTACHKGAQDAFAHIGLHLGDDRRIESSRRVKSHTFWQRLKHPINHTDVKTPAVALEA